MSTQQIQYVPTAEILTFCDPVGFLWVPLHTTVGQIDCAGFWENGLTLILISNIRQDTWLTLRNLPERGAQILHRKKSVNTLYIHGIIAKPCCIYYATHLFNKSSLAHIAPANAFQVRLWFRTDRIIRPPRRKNPRSTLAIGVGNSVGWVSAHLLSKTSAFGNVLGLRHFRAVQDAKPELVCDPGGDVRGAVITNVRLPTIIETFFNEFPASRVFFLGTFSVVDSPGREHSHNDVAKNPVKTADNLQILSQPHKSR